MVEELKTIETVDTSPFKHLVMTLGELPTSFVESMTYYECLAWLVNFIQNTVIPTVNNNAEAVEELQTAFTTLKNYVDNYFDNLDVQEEINNKLDEMVEDGTLQEIITTYIQSNVAWTFDTVADMKLSTNFVNGSYARTLGFHSINDGGGALYKITNTGTANEMDVIAIGNLFAHLIVGTEVTPEQFGAKGDGLTDDQNCINATLSSSAPTINFGKGKTYLVKGYEDGQPQGSSIADLSAQTGVVLQSNKDINLNGSTIKVIPNNRTNYNIFTLVGVENVCIRDGYILGDVDNHDGATGEWGYGISVRGGCKNIYFEKLICGKCWGDSINIAGYTGVGETLALNENITIKDCICDDNRRQGMSISHGKHIYVENSKFTNTGKTTNVSPSAGVDIEAGLETMYINDITFYNCEFSNNYGCGLSIIDTVAGTSISDILVDSCIITNNAGNHSSVNGIFSNRAKGIRVFNSTFDRGESTIFVNTFYFGKNCIIKNNIFNNMTVAYNGANMNGDKADIIGNTFNIDADDIQYNFAVHAVAYAGANTGNTVNIEENKFIRSLAKKDNAFAGWVVFTNDSGFTKLICKNNYFQFGDVHIRSKFPAIIKDNNFVGSKYQCLEVQTATDYIIVDNNTFEQTCWYSNRAGIINTDTANKLVVCNNTNFTRMLNSGLSFEPTRVPSRWYQNQPTTYTEQYNNIIDNS